MFSVLKIYPQIYEKITLVNEHTLETYFIWTESTLTGIGNHGIDIEDWVADTEMKSIGYNPTHCDNGVIIIGRQYSGPGTDGNLVKIIKI